MRASRRGAEVFERAIVEGVADIASGMAEPEGYSSPVLSSHYLDAVRLVGMRLRARGPDGLLYCPFCGQRRGPFTPRGYYLHLLRSHRQEILELVQSEASRIASVSRALRP
mgnify:CR=1 FL=1